MGYGIKSTIGKKPGFVLKDETYLLVSNRSILGKE